jgi:hypothetical protein
MCWDRQTREADDLLSAWRRRGPLNLLALERQARQMRSEALRTILKGAVRRLVSRIARSPTESVKAPSINEGAANGSVERGGQTRTSRVALPPKGRVRDENRAMRRH